MNGSQPPDTGSSDELDLDIDLDVRIVTWDAPKNASTDEPPYTITVCHTCYQTNCQTCYEHHTCFRC